MTLPGHRHSGPFAGITGSRAALVVCAGTFLLALVPLTAPPGEPSNHHSALYPAQSTSLSPALPQHPISRTPSALPNPGNSTPSTHASPDSATTALAQGFPSFTQRQRFLSAAARLIHPASTLTEITPDSPGTSLTIGTRKITVSAISSPTHQPNPVLEAEISPVPTDPLPLHTPRHPSPQGFSPEEALFRSRWGWNAWAAAQRAAFLNPLP